jgi:hypothetical protein
MDGINLTNTEFPFTFGGKEYAVKKANLSQVILFQRKAKEIVDKQDAGGDLMIVAFGIYLILNGVDKNITEEFVNENCPGGLDKMQTLVDLGFTSPPKAA